jgi:diadenylate cyclase
MKFIGDAAAFVWNIVQTIRPNDILDIAVVALIIYKIISFVAKTGLAKVIRGIIFLLAVLWLSTLLDLNVVEFLMGNTIELGFIAIIILFQPELRRMLERVGSSNWQERQCQGIGNCNRSIGFGLYRALKIKNRCPDSI